MSTTLENGIVVPVNSDAYAPTADMASMGNSAGVIKNVASQAARDALTTTTKVTRDDVPGQPIEIKGSGGWVRQGPVVQANTQTVGTGMAANAFTTGTKQPWWQGGTFVGTTDSSGNIGINYPVAFPAGVVTAVMMNGDSATGNLIMSISGDFTQSLAILYVKVRTANTGAIVPSASVRINWMALGW